MVQKFDFWFNAAGANRRIHLYLKGYSLKEITYQFLVTVLYLLLVDYFNHSS